MTHLISIKLAEEGNYFQCKNCGQKRFTLPEFRHFPCAEDNQIADQDDSNLTDAEYLQKLKREHLET